MYSYGLHKNLHLIVYHAIFENSCNCIWSICSLFVLIFIDRMRKRPSGQGIAVLSVSVDKVSEIFRLSYPFYHTVKVVIYTGGKGRIFWSQTIRIHVCIEYADV